MRWSARLLSISWAYWAWFWAAFALAHIFPEEEPLSNSLYGLGMLVIAPAFFAPAILASVWDQEALGGRLLIWVGGLILVGILGAALSLGSWRFLFLPGSLGILTMVLPAIVAGALFRACHRREEASAA
jgi:hypothetical protein